MPAVHAGKCDFAASGIAITEERAERVYFSDPNIYDRIFFAVLKRTPGPGLLRSRWRTVSARLS